MKDLQVFNFEQKNVRVVMKDTEPWWVAKDVCDVLEHSNARMALEGLDDDEKGVSKVYTPGGSQEMNIISESGLYTLILRSNKAEAKPFRRWVTHEVLPSLRRTGRYGAEGPEEREYLLRLIELSRGNVSKAFMESLVSRAAGFGVFPFPRVEREYSRANPKVEALVRRFVSEACRPNPNGKVSRREFYEMFMRWCEENDIEPMPSQTLASRVTNTLKLFPIVTVGGIRFWRGIEFD